MGSTLYVLALMTSINCGVDVICLRAIEADALGASFSVHDGTVSELATSSEPVPRQSGCDAELTLLRPDMAPLV
jgi:hypothetical protein